MCYNIRGEGMYINGKYLTIKNASGHVENFKGLMFNKSFVDGLRIRCNGIHTFFVYKNIDVVLTDKQNTVLYVYKNVKPYRIILPKKKVYYTYELPAGTIDDLNVGDKLG